MISSGPPRHGRRTVEEVERVSERSPLKRTKSVAPRRCRIREGVDGTTAHGGSRARSKGKERRRRSCWLGASPATQAYDDVPTTHSFPEKMLNVPVTAKKPQNTSQRRYCPGEGATRGVKDQRGPGMGLAVAWVRVEQQRALLGLHAAAGASWVTRGCCWLHCLFLYFQRALLSECYTF